jgi:uncharacterized integral membrane protein (TIGR00697 family)
LRATGSTAVSQLIDTLVINFVAWSGLLGVETILNMVMSSYLLKVLIALGLTPLVYLCHAAIERGLKIEPIALTETPNETSRAGVESRG